MAINYTQEQVDFMKALYNNEPTRETVQQLANELDKSVKSIIGKLSREGVYQKTEYLSKTGERPITKKQMVVIIAKDKKQTKKLKWKKAQPLINSGDWEIFTYLGQGPIPQ